MNQHPQDKPAVQFGETPEQAQAKRTPQPKLRTPEEIAFTAQELEKNISRLSQNASFPSNQPAQNFDALDYASISLSSPRRTENETPPREPTANAPDIDPYIDPSELRKSDLQSLRDTDAGPLSPKSEIKLPAANDSNEMISPSSDSHKSPMQPETHLETTGTTPVAHLSSGQHDNVQIHQELPPVTWFSDPLSIITPRTSPSTKPRSVVTPLKPESSEPFHDIRNFSDSASRKIELIRGAYRSDSESRMIQSPSPESSQQASSEIEKKKSEDIFDKDEVFLARTGDIINVNGEDGFDRIDLACYDVNCASISPNSIRIDDEQTGSFEIHFVGIDYAIFANGVKIRLDSTN
ncbi:hypothetical protein N9Z70_03760 [Mariniblastus sp.]|nr:hypothetical protein [Mariniblastus sp.]